jgi:hypothetical protein
MRSVKAKFHNGVATPAEPIEGHEGESVIITFLERIILPSHQQMTQGGRR